MLKKNSRLKEKKRENCMVNVVTLSNMFGLILFLFSYFSFSFLNIFEFFFFFLV